MNDQFVWQHIDLRRACFWLYRQDWGRIGRSPYSSQRVVDEFQQVRRQAEQMLVARQWVYDHREDAVRGHEAGDRLTRADHPEIEHIIQCVWLPALNERPGVVAEIVAIPFFQNSPDSLGVQRGGIANEITPSDLLMEIVAEVKAAIYLRQHLKR